MSNTYQIEKETPKASQNTHNRGRESRSLFSPDPYLTIPIYEGKREGEKESKLSEDYTTHHD